MKIKDLWLYVFGVFCFTPLLVIIFNPFGWGQRAFFGQKPPYHWIQQDVSLNTEGSVYELYIGANGNDCATVYHYDSFMVGYTVYGFGFSEDDVSRAEAERKAQQECR